VIHIFPKKLFPMPPDIPSELVVRFFMFTLGLPRPLNSSGRAVFQALRSVCQQWRTVGYTTKELWMGLAVEMGTTTRSNIDSWYGRAPLGAPYALEASFGGWDLECGDNLDPILDRQGLLDLLKSYKWSHLRLYGLAANWQRKGIEGVYEACRHSYSTLRTFTLEAPIAAQEKLTHITEDEFPKIHELFVAFNICSGGWAFRKHGVLTLSRHRGLQILTLYDLHHATTPALFADMVCEENLPALRELCIAWSSADADWPADVAPPPSDPTSIRRNASVRAFVVRGKAACQALRHISFPALDFFQLGHIWTSPGRTVPALQDFLQRCPPRVLSLEGCFWDMDDIEQLKAVATAPAARVCELYLHSGAQAVELDVASPAVFPRLQKVGFAKDLEPPPSTLALYLARLDSDQRIRTAPLMLSAPQSPVNAEYRGMGSGGGVCIEERRAPYVPEGTAFGHGSLEAYEHHEYDYVRV